MSPKQKIELRRSQVRQRLGEIAALEGDALTDEIRTERDGLMVELRESEPQLQAAIAAEEADEKRADNPGGEAPDPEMRERLELRGKAKLGNYLVAALRGRLPSGAEAELAAAADVDGIPFELWDVPQPERREAKGETEQRAITEAPTSVGLNLDPLRPMVFAPSIAGRLMVDMPMVESGTFASGTITTAATAGAKGKSEEVPETEASFTTVTATPKRIGAALRLTLEDIASVGQANFESLLRQHISLVLSDELDDQMLNGDGMAPNLAGFFSRITNPNAPEAGVETWARFLAIQASGVEGLWASGLEHVSILCGPETYRLAAVTFQGDDAEESAAAYLRRTGAGDAGFWTNKRMPDKAAHIQQGLLCRKGRSMEPSPMRTAVCPHWGYFSIDDIYTGAGKGERRFVLSALVGDVILVQPDAYAKVAFRVST